MEDNSENINKIGKQARDIMERVFQGQKDIVNLETDKLAIVLKNWANKAVGQLEFKDMVDPANHLKPSFNIFEQKMLEYLGNALIEDAKTNAIKNGITLTEDDILVGLAEFSKKPELGSIINEIYSLHVEPKFREMEKAAIQLDEYKKNTINIPSKSELLNAVASNSR